MKKTIKMIFILIMFVFLMFSLTLCGEGDSTSNNNKDSNNEENTDKYETKEMTIVIRMMDAQDQWFRNKIKEFEKKYDVKITVATFDQYADLERMLKLEKDNNKNTIGLVKTPKEMVYTLYSKDYIMPVKDAGATDKDLSDYTDIAINVPTINGKVYYIPRKMETNGMLYLKSKVDEAVKGWEKFKDDINNIIKVENGYGLPDGFKVEADPNQWDWYDLIAVSYYWANTEQADGMISPRMAHRGKLYSGTVTELANKIFQAGGKSEDLLKGNTDPVLDALEWEAFFSKNGLYNPGMWEQRWSGGGIWNAMQQGQVYLAFMHQIDAFFIHGVEGNLSMPGYLVDPDDMAMALMPKGVSLEMENGKPVREGGHYAQLAGWWWGIPKTTPSKKLSYDLARWITSPEVHSEESSTFGMMPVTKEVLNNSDKYFKSEWKRKVFEIASKQFEAGVYEIPTVSSWPTMEQIWLEIWDKIAVQRKYSPDGKDGKIDRDYILEQIKPDVEEIKKLANE
jgi:ABC-type glycerol-3-phosphate transport system substrate-binding protein